MPGVSTYIRIQLHSVLLVLFVSFFYMPENVWAEGPREESPMLNVGVNLAIPNLLDFKGGKLTGSESHKYSCVLESIPYQYVLSPVPIARLQVMLAEGFVDLALMVSQTDERDKAAVIAAPITNAVFQVATRHSMLPSKQDIKLWRIGGLRGSSFLEFARVNLSAEAIATSSWNSGFEMLHRNRLDAMLVGDVIVDGEVAPRLLEGLNLFTVGEVYGSIYTSKKQESYESVHEAVQRAIKSCVRSNWQKTS